MSALVFVKALFHITSKVRIFQGTPDILYTIKSIHSPWKPGYTWHTSPDPIKLAQNDWVNSCSSKTLHNEYTYISRKRSKWLYTEVEKYVVTNENT